MRRVTSFDVAAAAGVSQSTVSRALCGGPGVSAATRDRIRHHAAQLRYAIDRRAVGLRTGETGRIAVILLARDDSGDAVADALPFALLRAIESAAAKRNYSILVSFQDGRERLRGDFVQTAEADGAIIVASARNRTAWRFFRAAAATIGPAICWGAPDDALPTVRCDNRAAARAMTDHLIATGRRRIAFVGPAWQRHRAFRDRRAGYRDAVTTAGLQPIDMIGDAAGSRHQQGAAAARAIVALSEPVDAVFAACDGIAIGLMRMLQRLGVVVPDQVAVAGFDGLATVRHVTPTLTTVEQDIAAAGLALVDGIIALIAQHDAVPPTIPARLLIRQSTAEGP